MNRGRVLQQVQQGRQDFRLHQSSITDFGYLHWSDGGHRLVWFTLSDISWNEVAKKPVASFSRRATEIETVILSG